MENSIFAPSAIEEMLKASGLSLQTEVKGIGYNPEDYPALSVMVDYMIANKNKPAVYIDYSALAANGVVFPDEMKTYLANKAEGSSAIKEITKTPAHYQFYKNDKENFKAPDKKYFELGTFSHMAFLERKLFKMTKVEPTESLASGAGMDKMIAFYRKLNGSRDINMAGWKMDRKRKHLARLKAACKYVIIKQEHKQIIKLIEKNYVKYGGGVIPMLLKGAMHEMSFYGEDPKTGRKVKVRPDAINFKENIGVDAVISFKTSAATTIEKFQQDAAKLCYDVAEGMYQVVLTDVTGRKFNTTITILMQTAAPYLVAVLFWNPEDIIIGKNKYREALDTIAACEADNYWPGFEIKAEAGNHGIINMKMPDWAAYVPAE